MNDPPNNVLLGEYPSKRSICLYFLRPSRSKDYDPKNLDARLCKCRASKAKMGCGCMFNLKCHNLEDVKYSSDFRDVADFGKAPR